MARKKYRHQMPHGRVSSDLYASDISDPDISIDCALDFKASDQSEAIASGEPVLPSYSGQAYNGDEIYQPAFPFPLYVNLLTAKVAKNPQQCLREHDASRPIGHHTAVITATGMRLENGVLSVPNAHRDEVAAAAKNGFP